MDSKHTPWKFIFEDEWESPKDLVDSRGESVLEPWNTGADDAGLGISEDAQAFVLRAINNHEALLAALEEIRDIATAGLDEADRRNLMAAIGSLRVIQHGAHATIEAASTTSGEETK